MNSDIFILDTNTNLWSKGNKPSSIRQGMACATGGDYFVVWSGNDNGNISLSLSLSHFVVSFRGKSLFSFFLPNVSIIDKEFFYFLSKDTWTANHKPVHSSTTSRPTNGLT